jgi:uncharacterized protein (DUF58 family)
MIAVSGWFSERAIRDIEVVRETPRGVPVGQEVRIVYRVRNRGRLPALAFELAEEGLPEKAFVPRADPGDRVSARSYNRFVRRGVYPLRAVTLSTTFPFGLFVKERDFPLLGELVIWPRADRAVGLPQAAVRAAAPRPVTAAAGPGSRGEYRSLHEYRPGDDARDIHWRTSARLAAPVVREYEAEAADELWILLDTRGEPGDSSEILVEVAASLASAAAREGRAFALVADGTVIPPASGPGHLELLMDALARVDFRPQAQPPRAPPGVLRSALVSNSAGSGGLYPHDATPAEERTPT